MSKSWRGHKTVEEDEEEARLWRLPALITEKRDLKQARSNVGV